MNTIKWLPMVGCTALTLMLTAPLLSAQRNDILVVPARARMVRLGFDVHALRGVTLMSYRETDDPMQPLVHVWNRSRRNWQSVNLAEIRRTANVPATPQNVFLIGPASIVPDILLTSLAHANQLHRMQTFSVAEILTELDQTMDFSLQEWRDLARRFDLEITEVHQERSRWGRFGPPPRYRDQQEIPQHVIEAPENDTVAPRNGEPIRETQRITIPEPIQEPEPTVEQEPTEDPLRLEDAFDVDIIDPIIRVPEPQTDEEKGLRQTDQASDDEESAPSK